MRAIKIYKIVPVVIAIFVFGEVVCFALVRYWSLGWAMGDLANMTQAIWSVTQGHPLVYTPNGIAVSRLAGHAEVIYFFLVPFLKLWPSAATLLILQALVFASGVWPAYRLGMRRTGQGMWAALLYAFYPVAQTAVLFDIHGDPFGAAFLMWALDAFDGGEKRRFLVWTLLALLSKVYVAVIVGLMVGALWPSAGKEKRGWLKIALGMSVSWFGVAFWGFKMWFAHSAKASAYKYIAYRYGNLFSSVIATWRSRVANAIVVLLPVVFWFPWARVLFLPAIVIVFLASISSVGTYGYQLHHYILTVPFFVYGITVGTASVRRYRWWQVGLSLWTAVSVGVGFVYLVVIGMFLAQPAHVPLDTRAIARGRAVVSWSRAQLSSDAPLLVWHNLIPFFATRSWVSSTVDPVSLSVANEALLDAFWEGKDGVRMAIIPAVFVPLLNASDWGLVDDYDGVLLLRKHASSFAFGRWAARAYSLPLQAACGEGQTPLQVNAVLRLLCYRVEVVGPRRVAVTLSWQLTGMVPVGNFAAITQIGGWVPQGERKIHLATWLLLPLRRWPGADSHQAVQEQMLWSLHLPNEGCFPIRTAWYRLGELGAYYPANAPHRRWGQELLLGSVVLERGSVVKVLPGECPSEASEP